VRWFDAGAESELTGQATARERSLLDQLNRDLDFVQVSLAKQDDILIVRELPSRELRKHWIECGIKLPEFRLIEQLDQLSGRRLHDLQPWAWTPNSHRLARPLLQSTRHQPPVWQVSQGDLYRKSWPMAVQDRARDFGGADGEIAGSFVESVAEAQSAINQIGGRGDYAFALAKRDLGTSGRGQRRISCDGNMTDEDRKWLQTMLGRGGLVIEPLLDRVVDLSFLWRWPVTAQQPKFVGWTRPIVTNGRRYAGTRLGSPFGDCPDDVKRFLLENRCRRLREATSWLEENVVTELQSSGFAGDFGIDAMVYRAKDGALRIRPLVELNPRQTMGHVAQAFKRKPAPGVLAEFRIFTAAEWRALAPAIVERPIEQSRTGQWTSGVVRLSDVQAESKLVPAVLVGPATEL
jgi:hypothetical protein